MRSSAADAGRRRAFNRALFTRLAPDYDRLNPWISFGRDAGWKRAMIGRLPDLAAPVCVDLACGTGDLTMLLAARYPAGGVTGVDLTEAMLEQARRRPGADRIEFRCADLASTGLPEASADIVTGAYALRLGPGVGAGLAEVARILRPGGTASFLDFGRPDSAAAYAFLLMLLRIWGALTGLFFHRSLRVYTYIAETLQHYPARRGMREGFLAAGFRDPVRRSYFFGVVDIWTATRAGGDPALEGRAPSRPQPADERGDRR